MKNSKEINNFEYDEINLLEIIQTLIRQKLLVLSFTFLSTFVFVTSSYFQKEIWKGTFNIVVNDENNNTRASFANTLISSSLGLKDFKSSNETQRLILSSPLILRPVYQYVKSYYEGKGLNTDNMTFKSWFKNELDINFEKGSNVLTIEYLNNDKKLILEVLNSISEKYKNYSRSERERDLNKTIDYLKTQKIIIKKNYNKSQKELNKFSIKHGLGDLDGFVGLGKSTNTLIRDRINNTTSLFSKENLEALSRGLKSNESSSAGQRYRNQFNMLQNYEAQYIDLSAKLKPKSSTLKEIKLKIDNLKSSLKRPNEILIKYKELKQMALRDEALLDQVDSNLEVTKLEKVKTPNPWVIISEPTINNSRVSPKRKQIAILSFLSSFIAISFFAIFKEKKSNILYSLDEIKKIMGISPDEIIYDSNPELGSLGLKNLINNDQKIKLNEPIGLINFRSESENKFLDSLIEQKNLNISLINESDQNKIDSFSTILIFTKEGSLKRADYTYLNKFVASLPNKNLRWIYQEKNF
ncbi:MAG: hypothetical protein JJ831_08220 [Prochlorococcus marinus XMU1422]|nr:hypothetical protein [Prochlorococcus marinus XMU1421]MBO7013285.1 hypothetical protein [Prochlorococcus marinus XMU1422]MCR8542260.1 Wzz/FepE/Etk N-terminal domain-containing protein [Prochlorococcus marinus XMU1423]